MKKCTALLSPHLSVCIAKYKPDGGKEVALSRAIAPNNDIVLRRERLNDSLFLVAV